MTSQFAGLRLRLARQMADYRERFAERLAHERETRSLSRADLAYRSGVSEATIKRIEERKVSNPRPITVRRLAEGLGIEATDLRPSEEMEAEQLAHIARQLDALLAHFKIEIPAEGDHLAETEVAPELAASDEQDGTVSRAAGA